MTSTLAGVQPPEADLVSTSAPGESSHVPVLAATGLADGTLLFEHHFLRAPFETVKRNFRATQKHIERDLGNLKTTSKEASKKKTMKSEDALSALDAMIAKVEALVTKLDDVHTKGTKPHLDVMQKRLAHVEHAETAAMTANQDDLDTWQDTRLDRWITDWALRSGYAETAKSLAESHAIEDFVDVELFAEITRIEAAIDARRCTEALAWCSENKNSLRKLKSTLEFELRLQEYIELARVGKQNEALVYWVKHLLPWSETHLKQLEQASSLLIYTPVTGCKSYKRLYDHARWADLKASFRATIYELHSLPPNSILDYALYAGLTALHLRSCYSIVQPPVQPSPFARTAIPVAAKSLANRNYDCPVCDPNCLGALAQKVPFAHYANSSLVCRITGKIMNEDNPPMAFPRSGYVYSMEAMEAMAAKKTHVTCPRSGEVAEFSALHKLFIL